MPSPVHPAPLEALLAASRAHPDFKGDVAAYVSHRHAARIELAGYPPRLKVTRVLCQLLAAEPELPIERVRLSGASGCSDFRGEITVVASDAERTWDFAWDCRWRARDAGYLDMLGFPDQSRAARDFDWQCFAVWAPRGPEDHPAG